MFRYLFILLSFIPLGIAQNTAVYPTTLPTHDTFTVLSNSARDDLVTTITSGATSIVLSDASEFFSPGSNEAGIIKIEDEFIKYCTITSNTLTVCTSGRGFDGSTAAAHNAGATVLGIYASHHHNQLAAELVAITDSLGPVNTVVNLPGSPTDGDLARVTDGNSVTDCVTGSGTDIVLCIYDLGATAWGAVSSGSNAPSDATYITQTTNATLSNEQALSVLATGILKSTTSTGVITTAVDGDFPSTLSRDSEAPAAGDITGSLSAGYQVSNDSHDHTGTTISALDAGVDIIAGLLALVRGGTASDLSATGGSNQFVRQSGVGSALTVSAIADGDIPALLTRDTEWDTIAEIESATSYDFSNASNLDTGSVAEARMPHVILSSTHTDSLTASVALGDILHGNVTPKWARLAGNTTTAKQFLSQTGTGVVSAVPAWSALVDSDIPDTITLTNITQITNRAVSDTTGNYVQSITNGIGIIGGDGGSKDAVLTLAFDFSDAGTDPALGAEECRFSNEGASDGGWVCEGLTANTIETRFRVTDPTASDKIITFPNATGEVSLLGQSIDLTSEVTGELPDANVADNITLTNITQITNRAIADTTGTLAVSRGGTGVTAPTDGGLLLGSGTGAFTSLGVATNGQIPIGDGTTDPVLANITAEAGGEISVTNGVGSIVLDVVETNLDLAAIGGTLTVGQGGTGSTSFTAGSVVFSNGTILTQDNANLFWNDTSNFLGLGTNTPSDTLELVGGAITLGNNIFYKARRGSDDARVPIIGFESGVNTLRIRGGYNDGSPSSINIEFENQSGTSLIKILAGGKVGFGISPETLFHLGGADAVTTIEETANTPTIPAGGTQVRMYIKANKFIIVFKDSGTVRYKYLDLTGTGVTWVHTTSAP